MTKHEKAGTVTVDSGLIWIGDPCYVRHKFSNWNKFLDKMWKVQKDGIARFKHKLGHDGLGICVGNFGGDGEYKVEVIRKKGLIKEVRVVF